VRVRVRMSHREWIIRAWAPLENDATRGCVARRRRRRRRRRDETLDGVKYMRRRTPTVTNA
jgi:hypothetical protein